MTKLNHTCENTACTITAAKDKYGNYKRYCSDDCKKISQKAKIQATLATKDMDVILEKRKATNIAKYGVTNVAQTDSVRSKLRLTTAATAGIRLTKTKETNLKNHGVESTNSLQIVKDRKKETFMEKYGVDHQLKIPEVAASVSKKNSENSVERLAKSRITKLEIYGDENYNNREQYKETCVERFGVENPSQNESVHAKQMQPRMVKYQFPSGSIVNVMGFEPQALRRLESIFLEEDIVLGKGRMPEIWYTLNGIKRRYYPDIFIPKENLIIEVKSKWTWAKDADTLAGNLAKKDGVLAAGHKYLLIMFDSTGNKLLTEIVW